MAGIILKSFIVTIAIYFCAGVSVQQAIPCETPASQVFALQTFYNTTNGVNWAHKTNWNIGDPCENQWYGVNCTLILANQTSYCSVVSL